MNLFHLASSLLFKSAFPRFVPLCNSKSVEIVNANAAEGLWSNFSQYSRRNTDVVGFPLSTAPTLNFVTFNAAQTSL